MFTSGLSPLNHSHIRDLSEEEVVCEYLYHGLLGSSLGKGPMVCSLIDLSFMVMTQACDTPISPSFVTLKVSNFAVTPS
jgi:hypothetical protein